MNYAYWYKLIIRINYLVDAYPFHSIITLFSPYFAFIISLHLIPDEHKLKLVLFSLLWGVVIISTVLIRQHDITFSLNNDSKHLKTRRQLFINKWLHRGRSQYIYIKPIDDTNIDIYVYSTINSSKLNFDEFSHYKSYWGSWNLSSTIPASEKEIERHNLSWIEAKILLGKENE